MKTSLIEFIEDLDTSDLSIFLKIYDKYYDPSIICNQVARYGKPLLLKVVMDIDDCFINCSYLNNAILSNNLEKVKMLFSLELFNKNSDILTRSVLKSTQEIYGFLMENGVVLDFKCIAI
jgi:hypothetical protein